MPIDASIPLSITPPNPLQMMGQMATIANAMNQNRLFQGQVAAGQAAQQAVGPDGQIDTPQFNSLIKGDPRAAPYAQEALTRGLAAQQAQLANQKMQGDIVGAYLGPLATSGATSSDYLNTINMLAKTQRITPQFAAAVAGNMPEDADAPVQVATGPDGKPIMGTKGALWVKQNFTLPNLGGQGALDATVGPAQTVSAGNQIDIMRAPQLGNGPTVVGSVPIGMGPEAASQRIPMVQGGVPGSVPQSALVDAYGHAKEGGVAGPGGFVQGSLTPAQSAAGAASGQGNTQMALNLTSRAAQVNDNKALLGNMEGLLDPKTGGFTPGPQATGWKKLGQLAQEYGIPIPLAPPATPTAAQEEYAKMGFMLAQSQFRALGGTGTDAKLDSTMHTSPSELLSRYGNLGIIHMLKGNEDAISAQSQAWQGYQKANGVGPESFTQFQNWWNKHYDPRVFQTQYMDPQERKQLMGGMTKPEQAQFQKRYQFAVDQGWVQ